MIIAGQHGEDLCTVVPKLTFVKSKMSTKVINKTNGQEMLITAKGDWRDKRCNIYLGEEKAGGILIGTITRTGFLSHHIFDKQDYILTIAPGVDAAFMVLLTTCFDEAENDQD